MSPFHRPRSRKVQSYSWTANALNRDRQIVIVELKVVLARSLARAPVGLHELIALLVQLVETRQLLQVRGVVERLEEHREAFLLVRLDDLDARHEIPSESDKQRQYDRCSAKRKKEKKNDNKNIIQIDVPSRCTRCTCRIVGPLQGYCGTDPGSLGFGGV